MADKSIRVAVLEGDFAGLSAAHSHFNSLQLQQSALKLPDAMWTAKSTAGGFSVSFFWPSVSSQTRCDKEKIKKRRKRKRKTKAKNSVQCKQSNAKADTEGSSSTSLTGAHHAVKLRAIHQLSLMY